MRIKESHRVVVMGSGGVGKTSIVTQFMQGMFTTTYKPTIEDYYSHNIQLSKYQFNINCINCIKNVSKK